MQLNIKCLGDVGLTVPISFLEVLYYGKVENHISYPVGDRGVRAYEPELTLPIPAQFIRDVIHCSAPGGSFNILLAQYQSTEMFDLAAVAMQHRMQRLHDIAIGVVLEKTAKYQLIKKVKRTSYERAVIDMCRSGDDGALFENQDRTQLAKKPLLALLRALPMGPQCLKDLEQGQLYADYKASLGGNALSAPSWFEIVRLKTLVETITTAGGPAQSPSRKEKEFVRFTGKGLQEITSMFKMSDADAAPALRDFDIMAHCEWSTPGLPRKDAVLISKAKCALVLETSEGNFDRMVTQFPDVLNVAKSLLPDKNVNVDGEPPKKKGRTDLDPRMHSVQMASMPSGDPRSNRRVMMSALGVVMQFAKDEAHRDDAEDGLFRNVKSDVRAIKFAVLCQSLYYNQAGAALDTVYSEMKPVSQNSKPGLLVHWWKLELAVRFDFNYSRAVAVYRDILPFFHADSCFGAGVPAQIELLYFAAALQRRQHVNLPSPEALTRWKQATLDTEFAIFIEALYNVGTSDLADMLKRSPYGPDDTSLRFPRWDKSKFLAFELTGSPA